MKKIIEGDRLYAIIALIMIAYNLWDLFDDLFDDSVTLFDVFINTSSTIIVLCIVWLMVLLSRKQLNGKKDIKKDIK